MRSQRSQRQPSGIQSSPALLKPGSPQNIVVLTFGERPVVLDVVMIEHVLTNDSRAELHPMPSELGTAI